MSNPPTLAGFSLRAASPARGIGCLDRRAQGRAQRFFLVPHAVVLCGLCAAARGGAVSGRGGGVRSRADVQTHGRDPAVRAASARRMASPARLVAVELALGESPAFRKAAALRDGGSRFGADLSGAAAGRGGRPSDRKSTRLN